MILELIKFIFFCSSIVTVSKFILMPAIRNLSITLNFSSSTTGKLTGYATSVPEFITTIFSAYLGLMSPIILNILFSNFINFTFFIFSFIMYKKVSFLFRKEFILQYLTVISCAIISFLVYKFHLYTNILIPPIFLSIFFIYLSLDKIIHKKQYNEIDKKEHFSSLVHNKKEKRLYSSIYSFLLLISALSLYFLGNGLSDSLEILFSQYNVSEILIGIILSILTSIPELTSFLSAQEYHHKSSSPSSSHLGAVEAINNLNITAVFNLFILQSIGTFLFILFHI